MIHSMFSMNHSTNSDSKRIDIAERIKKDAAKMLLRCSSISFKKYYLNLVGGKFNQCKLDLNWFAPHRMKYNFGKEWSTFAEYDQNDQIFLILYRKRKLTEEIIQWIFFLSLSFFLHYIIRRQRKSELEGECAGRLKEYDDERPLMSE